MNIKQAGQIIRDSVDMDSILTLYGYRPKRGYICCPFHGEKTPSLRVYKGTGGWHCFGCERGGSVIDFVMEHEQCNFNTAVRAIDSALHLNLMDTHENPEDVRQQQRTQDALDHFVEAIYSYVDAVVKFIEINQEKDYKHLKELEELQFGHADQLTADDYTFLMTWAENDQYNTYRAEKFLEFKEEVAAWRRKARRVM